MESTLLRLELKYRKEMERMKSNKKKNEKAKQGKSKKIPYMMNRELSWLKFNERVLNEAGNPRVPLAERLTFASIYQSNLDEFYSVRVGTLIDQMESSNVVRENKTNMTAEEQVNAILKATRELDKKKDVIYEQLMGELEPKGIRLINFHRLSAEEGKLLETYFDHEIAISRYRKAGGKMTEYCFDADPVAARKYLFSQNGELEKAMRRFGNGEIYSLSK